MANADAPITRYSSLAIVPDPENPNNGFYVPALTTTQRNAIPTDVLADGGIIYNTTDNQLQGRVNGAWGEIAAGGVADFIAPNSATDPATPTNGQIYYNTVTTQFKAYLNSTWKTLLSTTNTAGIFIPTIVANTGALPAGAEGMLVYQTDINVFKVFSGAAWTIVGTSTNTATGVGLTGVNAGVTPLVLPSGDNTAEVVGNQTNKGFSFYNTALNKLRTWIGSTGGWTGILTSTNTATGVGLTNIATGDTPLVLPSGDNTAEAAGNQTNKGFSFYNTALNKLRTWIGSTGGWTGILTSTNTATGIGLTNIATGDTPLVLPTGTNAAEVAGNQFNGFVFYNTDTNSLRARVNGAWVTITTGA